MAKTPTWRERRQLLTYQLTAVAADELVERIDARWPAPAVEDAKERRYRRREPTQRDKLLALVDEHRQEEDEESD